MSALPQPGSPRTTLCPSALRVLFAVIALDRAGRSITVRAIAARCGLTAGKRIHNALVHLRVLGLVSFAYGQCVTIRPTCAWTPAEE